MEGMTIDDLVSTYVNDWIKPYKEAFNMYEPIFVQLLNVTHIKIDSCDPLFKRYTFQFKSNIDISIWMLYQFKDQLVHYFGSHMEMELVECRRDLIS